MVNSLFSFLIIAVIFGCAIEALKLFFENKKRKMLINAYLKEKEMEYGYAPGSYAKRNKKRDKEAYKQYYQERMNENLEREELERKLSELEKRIENIKTVYSKREI